MQKSFKNPSPNSLFVINCDDFGWTEPRDRGILSLFQKGLISSTTVLINGPHILEALSSAKALNLPMGLHLNLTEGLPISNSLSNSLIIQDKWQLQPGEDHKISGVFRGKKGFFDAWEEGIIMKEDIFKEIQSQVIVF